jgi:hypothetical protein
MLLVKVDGTLLNISSVVSMIKWNSVSAEEQLTYLKSLVANNIAMG